MKTGEFADLIGCSRQNVLRVVKAGRLPKSARKVGKDWDIDPKLGRAEWRANIDQGKRPPAPLKDRVGPVVAKIDEPDYPDFAESHARREYHLAAIAELELAEMSRSLIPKSEYEKTAVIVAEKTREAMMRIPGRVSDDLMKTTDPFEIHARLTKEIREALVALADELRGMS